MFKPILAAAALAVATTGIALPMPAAAQNYGWADRGDQAGGYQTVGYRQNRHYRGDDRRYRNNSGYRRGNNGRCYDKGNGGLAIGGIAGGLAGNAIAGRGDRTLGTILGAGVGALAGRAIDKSDGRRC